MAGVDGRLMLVVCKEMRSNERMCEYNYLWLTNAEAQESENREKNSGAKTKEDMER